MHSLVFQDPYEENDILCICDDVSWYIAIPTLKVK